MFKRILFCFCLTFSGITFGSSDVISNYEALLRKESITKNWIQQYVSGNASIDADLITNHILFNAATQEVPLDLLIGTIAVESRFNTNARSSSGAKGIMQVMPRYHKDKIRNRNIFDPKVGLEVGTQILSKCLDTFHGNRRKALSCYSGYRGKQAAMYQKAVLDQSARFRAYAALRTIVIASN